MGNCHKTSLQNDGLMPANYNTLDRLYSTEKKHNQNRYEICLKFSINERSDTFGKFETIFKQGRSFY